MYSCAANFQPTRIEPLCVCVFGRLFLPRHFVPPSVSRPLPRRPSFHPFALVPCSFSFRGRSPRVLFRRDPSHLPSPKLAAPLPSPKRRALHSLLRCARP